MESYIYIFNPMSMKLLFYFLLLAAAANAQLLASTWSIQANDTSVWEEYGLTVREGLCNWVLRDSSQNVVLELYQDSEYQSSLRIKIYLNYSINKAYPFYDGLAHVQYKFYEETKEHLEVKNFSIMPYVYFFNNTLEMTQNNSTLLIDVRAQPMSGYVFLIAVAHLLVKLALFGLMIDSFRRDSNKLSFSFVYVLIGWELQSHLLVIRLFEASNDAEMMGLGIMIGLIGWGAVLCSLFLLPRAIYPWQSFEGLIYYAYECGSGFLFTQATNITLYALSPLLQVRFNVMRNVKNSVCPYAISLYFINILLLYYVKGCPACLLRFPMDLSLCVKVTLLGVAVSGMLWMQERLGPMLCARQLVNGKDFKYMEQINLSEGEEMIEEVCAICLQPLTTEALVQNVREVNGSRIGQIMKTPCEHKYHPSCLRKWMQEKSTCPLDNQVIPPCFE